MLQSYDPGIDAVVAGADRGDWAVVPALRDYLERARLLIEDKTGASARTAAAVADKPQAEKLAAFRQLGAPLSLLDYLVAAAMRLPDASLEPVLKDLSRLLSHEGVRNALAKVRSVKPTSAADAAPDPNVNTSGIPSPGDPGDGMLAKAVRDNDHRGMLAAVTEATIGDLLAGLAECIGSGHHFKVQIVNACHRYPEAEVLVAVQPWISDADPRRREAAAWALARDGQAGGPPNPRTMAHLHVFLTDREPAVVAAALHALAQRIGRNFTPSDLERMRLACEHHPSVKVRGKYSDVFFSPHVGHDHAPGALDVWCRMTRDADAGQRSAAVGRLRTLLFPHRRKSDTDVGKISAVLNAARTDASANVRFTALAGLTDLGENHKAQIGVEFAALADVLERTNFDERTDEADDGLDLVREILAKPSRIFLPSLQRIITAMPEEQRYYWDDLLEACRTAPR
jgi:hypothetical protein